jgi:hypothetical protein
MSAGLDKHRQDRESGLEAVSSSLANPHARLVAPPETTATKMSPMALGVANHIWTIGELVEAALQDLAPKPVGRMHGPFRVIDGGLA